MTSLGTVVLEYSTVALGNHLPGAGAYRCWKDGTGLAEIVWSTNYGVKIEQNRGISLFKMNQREIGGHPNGSQECYSIHIRIL